MKGGEKNMGIIEAIDAIDIQTALWLFMLYGGYYLWNKKQGK